MVTSSDCLKAFGSPELESAMIAWDVPLYIEQNIPVIPRRIYCNYQMIIPLEVAFLNIIDRGLTKEVKTWDGCFNIRKKKGGNSYSLHSWGIAIDINAAWNGWKQPVQMNPKLAQCFKDADFNWGGDWKNTLDGMHFELSYIN